MLLIPILNTINTAVCITIIQHFSDCDRSAIFRISSKEIAIWNNSYQHPMQLDLFQTSSKLWLTWAGVHVLRVLSINCISSTWQSLFSIRHNEYVIPGYQHIFSPGENDVRSLFAHVEVRDHYSDVGYHLLVQDAPGLIHKYMMLIHVAHFFSLDIFKTTIRFPMYVHRFPCSGPFRVFSCSQRRPPRKISTTSPDLEFISFFVETPVFPVDNMMLWYPILAPTNIDTAIYLYMYIYSQQNI
jgi:hypothetical protein